MKKILSTLFFVAVIVAASFAQSKSESVEIIYFHRTTRCHTCNSIEKVTTDLLNKDYKKEMQSGAVTFKSIDYQEDSTNNQVLKFKVEGPTLLLVFHSKKEESQVDLTDMAFENAVSSPAILKKEITERIDGFFR